MLYMKFLHPIIGPYIEPAFNRLVGYIWGPQAVQGGCPIRPKNKQSQQTPATSVSDGNSGDGPAPSTSQEKGSKED